MTEAVKSRHASLHSRRSLFVFHQICTNSKKTVEIPTENLLRKQFLRICNTLYLLKQNCEKDLTWIKYILIKYALLYYTCIYILRYHACWNVDERNMFFFRTINGSHFVLNPKCYQRCHLLVSNHNQLA